MILKSKSEIELIRQNCLMVSDVLALVAGVIKPGVTGKYLDQLAEEYIRDQGAEPGFKGYNGFPSTLCISINQAVVHGIPTDIPFNNGDIVSIDCGVKMNGYFGDAAFTFPIGDISYEAYELCSVTKTALYLGIEKALINNRVGDVSFAIQHYTETVNSFGVVRELVGHGLGQSLHEPPEVPNFGKRGRGPKLKEGLVIAIEPMINLGSRRVKQLPDGWTIVTADGKPSAHYEHSIAVTADGPDILSDHVRIEDALKKNENIHDIPVKKADICSPKNMPI